MKKFELVEALKGKGFVEQPNEADTLRRCSGRSWSVLQRTWAKEIDVAWYGKRTATYEIRVFVNLDSGICHVIYLQNDREYKSRWYDTIGKRTYNAMVETARCAGYEF